MNKIHALACASVFLIISFIYGVFIKAPTSFPLQKIITVDKRLSADEIGNMLKETHIIRSTLLFKVLTNVLNYDRKINSGDYYFEKPLSVFDTVDRLLTGTRGIPMIKVTIPEGSNNEEIAVILTKKIATISGPIFLKKAFPYQGTLFPDTYNIPSNADESFVISLLQNTFKIKVKTISIDELKMASILEEEGNSEESRKMIADILWRRLATGMRLQVDVYRPSYEKNGLPPAPITNPGLQSIDAARAPTKNLYVYYISDTHGIFHYAKTYEEHLVNIQKYLKK